MSDSSKAKPSHNPLISDYEHRSDSDSQNDALASKNNTSRPMQNWSPSLIESNNSGVSQVYIVDSPSNNERISEIINVGRQIGKTLRHIKTLESDLLKLGTPREIIEQRILAELNLRKGMK